MTTRARGPYAKTEARREEILDRATQAFGRHGFRGASLREIAESVGLSQAGVLHHFVSKESLLLAVLERRDLMTSEQFRAVEDLGVLAGLRAVVVHNVEQRGLVRLFTTLGAEALDPEHPAHTWFAARYTASRTGLAEVLKAAQERGAVDPEVRPAEAAAVVLATMDGLQVQWLLDASFDMVGAFDAFLRSSLAPRA